MIEEILVFFHALELVRELGTRTRDAFRATRGLLNYFTRESSQGLVAFHKHFSTLQIPGRDVNGNEVPNIIDELSKTLQRDQVSWTLILGPVGSGKTSTLSLLFARLAEMKKKRKIRAIPILIRLRDNWKPKQIEETLEQIVGKDVCSRLLRKQYPLILLLDGLDE